MEEKKLENDILLKTSVMGFDKKGVMDFIEKLQLENEDLKRQIVTISAENEELRDAVEKLQRLHDSYEEDSTFVTYEDLSVKPYELEQEAARRADLAERTITAYAVIQEEQPHVELVEVPSEESVAPVEEVPTETSSYDLDGYTGEYPEFDAYPAPANQPTDTVSKPIVTAKKTVTKVRITKK